VKRKEEFGGDLTFDDYESLEEAFRKEVNLRFVFNFFFMDSVLDCLSFLQELHPGDLKAAVEVSLNKLLDPVRAEFNTPQLKKLTAQAYPPPPKQSQLIKDN
jgi:tyrosyl-tRNA synthetase